MSKITTYAELGKITDPSEFMRQVSNFLLELQPVINGKVEFDSNFLSQTITTYFPAANSDLIVTHKLNKKPVQYLVGGKSAACDIYHGSAKDTLSNVYLKSTIAGVTVTLVLF